MFPYQLAVTILLLVPFAIAFWNYTAFAAIRRREHPARSPRISVLVPARNEERTIGPCIHSLMMQEYDDFEVIVLDDESDDVTGIVLHELRREFPGLTVLEGLPLPPGWVGKSWACHQLAGRATGEWLLFTDADTEHDPRSLAAAMAFAERTGAHFFSAVPHQRLPGFWQRVMLPMVTFLYFAYLPNRWILTRRDPQFCGVDGHFLCVTRRAYDTIGGHEAVRSHLTEDFSLGRAAKRAGVTTAMATALETVSCPMYRPAGDIVADISKNIYAGLDFSIVALIFFLISTLLLYVTPLVFLVAAVATGSYTLADFWLPLLQILLAATMRGMLAIRFRMDLRQLLYHPLSALLISGIALRSAGLAYSRRGTPWKGRSYGRRGRGGGANE